MILRDEEAERLLDELAEKSPAFKAYLEKRRERKTDVRVEAPLKKRWVDWQVDYGPLRGEAGDVKDVELGCLCVPFKPEKFLVMDVGADEPCTATEILSFSIGDEPQPFPVGPIADLPVPCDTDGAKLPMYRQIVAAGMRNIDPPGTKSGFRVKFLKTGTFDATVWGGALVPK